VQGVAAIFINQGLIKVATMMFQLALRAHFNDFPMVVFDALKASKRKDTTSAVHKKKIPYGKLLNFFLKEALTPSSQLPGFSEAPIPQSCPKT
jgi:hypothetical protein